MQGWLDQIDAEKLVKSGGFARWIRRIDHQISGRCRCSTGRNRCGTRKLNIRKIVGLDTTAYIDVDVINLATLWRIQSDLGRAAIVPFLHDFECHRARYERQIQEDCEQYSKHAARRREAEILCNPVNHPVFLDVSAPPSKEITVIFRKKSTIRRIRCHDWPTSATGYCGESPRRARDGRRHRSTRCHRCTQCRPVHCGAVFSAPATS